MVTKNIKIALLFVVTLFSEFSLAQGNPGFVGHKIAIGYSSQISGLNAGVDLLESSGGNIVQKIINHDFYCELARSKYKSIAFHLAYQKIPIEYYDETSYYSYGNILQTVRVGATNRELRFKKVSGTSDFSMLGLGFRYTKYNRKNTIAAPVGYGRYFRVDVYLNKPLNNLYKYETTEDMFDSDAALANKNFKRGYYDKRSPTLSIGYGNEYKFALSERMFIRLDWEMNLNLPLLRDWYTDEVSTEIMTVEEEMQKSSKHIIDTRNLFLFGIGIGTLL